jgi:ribosomal protein S18 acetylase RimI-like enzyme
MALEQIKIISQELIEEFLNIYNKVLVSRENLNSKLDVTSNLSFSNSGGIFKKPSREDLHLLNADNSVTVVKTVGERVVGFIFGTFGTNNNFEDYSYVKPLLKEKNEEQYLASIEIKNDTLFYITDLVVDPDFQNIGTASQLMEELNKIIASNNAELCLSIIYDVKRQGSDEVLTNKSMRLFKKYGGRSIGYLKNKLINIAGYDIEILPHLVVHKPF